jgi:dual specificity MAP kinase phosphatase
VLDLQAERPDDGEKLKAKGIEYLHLPIKDAHPPELAQIESMVDWINSEILKGRKVYMHCAAGVGRAPTMAIAYLVSTGLGVDAAYAEIKRKHPDTGPGPKQFEAVREYEEVLTARNSHPPGELRSKESE